MEQTLTILGDVFALLDANRETVAWTLAGCFAVLAIVVRRARQRDRERAADLDDSLRWAAGRLTGQDLPEHEDPAYALLQLANQSPAAIGAADLCMVPTPVSRHAARPVQVASDTRDVAMVPLEPGSTGQQDTTPSLPKGEGDIDALLPALAAIEAAHLDLSKNPRQADLVTWLDPPAAIGGLQDLCGAPSHEDLLAEREELEYHLAEEPWFAALDRLLRLDLLTRHYLSEERAARRFLAAVARAAALLRWVYAEASLAVATPALLIRQSPDLQGPWHGRPSFDIPDGISKSRHVLRQLARVAAANGTAEPLVVDCLSVGVADRRGILRKTRLVYLSHNAEHRLRTGQRDE